MSAVFVEPSDGQMEDWLNRELFAKIMQCMEKLGRQMKYGKNYYARCIQTELKKTLLNFPVSLVTNFKIH